MLQYRGLEHLLDADAERLLLRAFEQHAETQAGPLGQGGMDRRLLAPLIELRADAAVARRQGGGLFHRTNGQIEIAVGVGDGAEKGGRLREGRVDLERLLQRRNRRVVPAERICRVTCAEVKRGVARAPLQRFAEQARRAGVVAIVERRPGFGGRHFLATGQPRTEQGQEQAAAQKQANRTLPPSHDAARGKERSERKCGRNRALGEAWGGA